MTFLSGRYSVTLYLLKKNCVSCSFLENYALAIRAHREKLPLSLIEMLPPERIIATETHEYVRRGTPIERIMISGEACFQKLLLL